MEKILLIVLGAFIGAVPTLIMGWMNLKATKERHMRELGLKMALAEYKVHTDLVVAKGKGKFSPPSAYLAPAYQSVLKLMDTNLSTTDFDKVYTDLAEIARENSKAAEESLPKAKGKDN
ncbi:MAG: hypothetical protein JEY79_02960 [Pseudodesulfovibrio sp.]|nr:hypothetical protein [Pseudodesulfovibrio sp.]